MRHWVTTAWCCSHFTPSILLVTVHIRCEIAFSLSYLVERGHGKHQEGSKWLVLKTRAGTTTFIRKKQVAWRALSRFERSPSWLRQPPLSRAPGHARKCSPSTLEHPTHAHESSQLTPIRGSRGIDPSYLAHMHLDNPNRRSRLNIQYISKADEQHYVYTAYYITPPQLPGATI